MSDELKIVVTIRGNRAFVGIQAPECDPVLYLVEGDLPAIMGGIPGLVEQAREKWASNPRYPKCETKLEPPPQVIATQRSSQPTTKQQDTGMKRLL